MSTASKWISTVAATLFVVAACEDKPKTIKTTTTQTTTTTTDKAGELKTSTNKEIETEKSDGSKTVHRVDTTDSKIPAPTPAR